MPRRTTATTTPRTVASPAPTLSQADEARLARDQRTLERGDAMAPDARLDRDLAHLATPDVSRRAQPRRRREPDHLPMIYVGKKSRALLVDQFVTLIVPTDKNDLKVADLEEVIPGLDRDSQQKAWATENARLGVERPYRPLADRLIVAGNDYTFERGKTVLVHEDDVPFLLAHEVFRFERASDVEVDDALPRRRPGYRGS